MLPGTLETTEEPPELDAGSESEDEAESDDVSEEEPFEYCEQEHVTQSEYDEYDGAPTGITS